jgi:hypothetical protein
MKTGEGRIAQLVTIDIKSGIEPTPPDLGKSYAEKTGQMKLSLRLFRRIVGKKRGQL